MIVNLVIFLLNPVIGLFTYSFSLLNKRGIKDSSYMVFYLLLAVFLGFINMTKLPQTDLAYHASQYLTAGNYGFFDYLSWQGREVSFYSFNWFFYYLSGGSIKFWILAITFISYYLLFISIHKFFRKYEYDRGIIFFAIILAAFFPQLFSLSAHLVRQFMAASILIYFLVEKLVYNKNRWYLPIIGIFVHSSSIIFFPLAFVFFLKEKVQRSNVTYFIGLAVVLFFYQLVAAILLPAVSGNASLEYALERASQDTTFNLGDFQLVSYVFLVILSIIAIRLVFVKKIGDRLIGFNHFANILFILIFFILINIRQSELSNRLFFYVWFFFPFMIPLLFSGKEFLTFRRIVSTFMIIFFVYRLAYGTWTYDSIKTLITSTSFYYFTKPEFRL